MRLLERSAPVAIAKIYRKQHREVAGQLRLVLKAADAKEVHALRVAVRQLRSLMRAYSPYIVANKQLKKSSDVLKTIGKRSNASRETTIACLWVEQKLRRGRLLSRGCSSDVLTFLQGKEKVERKRFRKYLKRDKKSLLRDLEHPKVLRHKAEQTSLTFHEVFVRSVLLQAAEVEECIKGAQEEVGLSQAHALRLSLKRLRYFLEPMQKHLDGIEPMLDALKKVQGVLGSLEDLRVVEEYLLSMAEPLGGIYLRSLAKELLEKGLDQLPELRSKQEESYLAPYYLLLASVVEERERLLSSLGFRLPVHIKRSVLRPLEAWIAGIDAEYRASRERGKEELESLKLSTA